MRGKTTEERFTLNEESTEEERERALGESPALPDELWSRTCDVMLKPDNPLTEGQLELLDTAGNQNGKQQAKHICLPTDGKRLLKTLTRQNDFNWLSEVIRRLVLHGLAIHNHNHGDRLHAIYDKENVTDAIFHPGTGKNRDIMKAIRDDIETDKNTSKCTTCDFNRDFWKIIDDTRDEAGFKTEEGWLTYLMLLSLRTHPALSDWYGLFNAMIGKVQEQLNERIEKLERVTSTDGS